MWRKHSPVLGWYGPTVLSVNFGEKQNVPRLQGDLCGDTSYLTPAERTEQMLLLCNEGRKTVLSTFPFADTCAEAGHSHFLYCTGFSVPPFCVSWLWAALLTGNLCTSSYKWMVSDHFYWPYLAGCESICGPVPHLFIQWPGELNPWLAGACQENYCSI